MWTNHRTGIPMILVLALLSLVFLPSPWNFVGALASGAVFAFEVAYWQRRMRRRKVQTGAENLVGPTGRGDGAAHPFRPDPRPR